MEKWYKVNVTETKATRIYADGSELVKQEGIEGFAKAWLNLTNNQREHKQEILKIYNNHDNGIYVVCDNYEVNVQAVEDYLERLGFTVVEKEEVAIVQPEEVFNDDLETELIDW